MKEKKVIAFKNYPRRMPLLATMAWWLFLDRVQAPEWAWTIIALLLVVAWVCYFHSLVSEKEVEVDLFEHEADRVK